MILFIRVLTSVYSEYILEFFLRMLSCLTSKWTYASNFIENDTDGKYSFPFLRSYVANMITHLFESNMEVKILSIAQFKFLLWYFYSLMAIIKTILKIYWTCTSDECGQHLYTCLTRINQPMTSPNKSLSLIWFTTNYPPLKFNYENVCRKRQLSEYFQNNNKLRHRRW